MGRIRVRQRPQVGLAEQMVLAGRFGRQVTAKEAVAEDRERRARAADQHELPAPVQPVEHRLLVRDRKRIGRQSVPDDVADRAPRSGDGARGTASPASSGRTSR